MFQNAEMLVAAEKQCLLMAAAVSRLGVSPFVQGLLCYRITNRIADSCKAYLAENESADPPLNEEEKQLLSKVPQYMQAFAKGMFVATTASEAISTMADCMKAPLIGKLLGMAGVGLLGYGQTTYRRDDINASSASAVTKATLRGAVVGTMQSVTGSNKAGIFVGGVMNWRDSTVRSKDAMRKFLGSYSEYWLPDVIQATQETLTLNDLMRTR